MRQMNKPFGRAGGRRLDLKLGRCVNDRGIAREQRAKDCRARLGSDARLSLVILVDVLMLQYQRNWQRPVPATAFAGNTEYWKC
jgi:hypothetical protein